MRFERLERLPRNTKIHAPEKNRPRLIHPKEKCPQYENLPLTNVQYKHAYISVNRIYTFIRLSPPKKNRDFLRTHARVNEATVESGVPISAG
jgi:hypothetical protein